MEDFRNESASESPVVPLEYAGLWIAWDRDHSRIVASAASFDAALDAALDAGEEEPILAKVPVAGMWFVGRAR